MAIAPELRSAEADHRMPPIGTVEHLDWLANLEIPENVTPEEIPGFLLDNQIPESLAVFILTQNMTQTELTRQPGASVTSLDGLAFLDSRLIDGRSENQQFVWAALHQNPNIDNAVIAIHGRPHPEWDETMDYTYDLIMPVDSALSLDYSRGVEAHFRKGDIKTEQVRDPRLDRLVVQKVVNQKIVETLVYNSSAASEYDEHDPRVFLCALQEASRDLASFGRLLEGLGERAQAA